VAALGPSAVNLVLTIAVLTLPQFAVLARSATLALHPQDFVQAARALGASHGRILGTHVLPNITPTLAVQTSLSLSIVILVEAALSFLGLGAPPPAPSWGSMLSRGRQYMTIAPWLVLAPRLAIMLAVLGFNPLGDAQRDVPEPPRARARRGWCWRRGSRSCWRCSASPCSATPSAICWIRGARERAGGAHEPIRPD